MATLASQLSKLAHAPTAQDALDASDEAKWQSVCALLVALCASDLAESKVAARTWTAPTVASVSLERLLDDDYANEPIGGLERLRGWLADQGCTLREEKLPESDGDDYCYMWHIGWN